MPKQVIMKLPDEDYVYASACATRVGVPVATYCRMILREQRLSSEDVPRFDEVRVAIPVRAAAIMPVETDGQSPAFEEDDGQIYGESTEEDVILERRLADAPARPAAQAHQDMPSGSVFAVGRSAPVSGVQAGGLPRPGRHALGGRA